MLAKLEGKQREAFEFLGVPIPAHLEVARTPAVRPGGTPVQNPGCLPN
jgi:hypothetical protein